MNAKDEAMPGINPEGQPLEWPDPQPLILGTPASTSYPIEALPKMIRDAVEEVQSFVKAPLAMVASSALGSLSLATQAQADVKRAEKLEGPISTFLLTIADSGERKSTCDRFFTQPIHEYELRKAEEAKGPLEAYAAAQESWDARRNGIKERIRNHAKKGADTSEAEAALHNLEHEKPEPPRLPRLIYGDVTPEALRWNLAKVWPSAGIVSSEGGMVLGSYGMNQESIMRTLSLLNALWDGQVIQTDRRTSECFTVRGARLTMAIQVQEIALRSFFEKSGLLARGMGFLARFMIAWPESTQGSRTFSESPSSWPGLEAFHRRISEILDKVIPLGQEGALDLPMLSFSDEGKVEWVAFYNQVELQLSTGGEFYEIRDVASKIADNAARLAAQFQIFAGGGSTIHVSNVRAACRIAAWHLHEAMRMLGGNALPAGWAEAADLDAWLVKRCQDSGVGRLSTQEVMQYGPAKLRDKAALDAAMQVLERMRRAQRLNDGHKKFVVVNPKILGLDLPAIAIHAISATPSQEVATQGSKNSCNSSSNPPIPLGTQPSLPFASGADWDGPQPSDA